MQGRVDQISNIRGELCQSLHNGDTPLELQKPKPELGYEALSVYRIEVKDLLKPFRCMTFGSLQIGEDWVENRDTNWSYGCRMLRHPK